MALFLSTFVNRIDRKGRVSVPATFRAALGGQSFQGIVAFPSFRDSYEAIEACGMERMERLSASLDRLNPFSDQYDEFASVIFGASVQLPFDGEGRISLPEQLIAHAGVAERVAFVGRGATFQMWEPGAFEAFQGSARARARENRSALELLPEGGPRGGTEGGGGGGE